ncbi:MAG TPA: DUF5678 domain-containing protein [Chloroflexota bacterium]
MPEVDYAELQHSYGGQYVATRDDEVVANFGTYDELADWLEQATIHRAQLIIAYVERPDVIRIYSIAA